MERKDLKALWENEFKHLMEWEEVKRMARYAKATSVKELREYLNKRIKFPVPPVCTVGWSNDDWEKYFYLNSVWFDKKGKST
jgi:hypothetical protein